jgi:hypothetical protein
MFGTCASYRKSELRDGGEHFSTLMCDRIANPCDSGIISHFTIIVSDASISLDTRLSRTKQVLLAPYEPVFQATGPGKSRFPRRATRVFDTVVEEYS